MDEATRTNDATPDAVMGRQVSMDDAIRFFAARGVTLKCLVCQHERLLYPTPEKPHESWVVSAMRTTAVAELPSEHMSNIMLICAHCYHIHMHAARPIFEWAQANPAA